MHKHRRLHAWEHMEWVSTEGWSHHSEIIWVVSFVIHIVYRALWALPILQL